MLNIALGSNISTFTQSVLFCFLGFLFVLFCFVPFFFGGGGVGGGAKYLCSKSYLSL